MSLEQTAAASDHSSEDRSIVMTDAYAHHRPQFHISLPRGYLNDPNGPVEQDGTTHLFFQSRATTDTAEPVHWGHAASEDLVHWTLHRPAISPLPGGPDSGGCWSGNTILDGDRLRAYYSGKVDDSIYQSVLTAVSDDRGQSFGAPVRVVDDPSHDEGITMFRDPYVWKDGEQWLMAVGAAGPAQTAAIRHYRSSDGIQWEYAGELASLKRAIVDGEDTGEGWECPQVLVADGREVAVVAAWSHAGGPQSVLAFPLDSPERPTRVDHGDSFYAPSVMRGGPTGTVLFGWITEGRQAEAWKQAGWAGALSLPRRAWLDGDRLSTSPHPKLEALRVSPPRPASGSTVGAQAEIEIPAVTGRLRLRFGTEEHLDITLDVEAGTVEVDRSRASLDPRAHAGRSIAPDAFAADTGAPGVRVFIDGSVVEVFTGGGRSLTTRVYPTTPPPWRLEAPAGSRLWDLGRTVAPASEAARVARAGAM